MWKSRFSKIFLRIIIFILLFLWCTGFLYVQYLPSVNPSLVLFPFLKFVYSIVCHQQPEKCFQENHIYFFVCARCTGIYIGALLTSALSLFIYKKIHVGLKVIIISSLPLLADVLLYSSGVYNYSKTIALISGIFSGSAVFAYILLVLENFFFESDKSVAGIKVNESK